LESYDYAPAGQAVIVEGLSGFKRAAGRLSFKHPFPGQHLYAFSVPSHNWDVEALRSRLAEFEKATRWLRATSQVLFVLIFAVMPALYVRLEARPRLFVAGLAASLSLWWAASACLFYADRRLNRGDGVHRLQRLVHSLIAPGFALRGTEALSRDALRGFHPLAACAALMKREDFEEICRMALLDEMWRGEASPRLAETWLFGAMKGQEREAWLRANHLDLAELLAPPEANQKETKAYCPRCRTQFVFEKGTCNDCGISLILL